MNKIGSNDTLGVYLSPSEICLSEVKAGKNSRLQVQHLVKISTGFNSTAGMTRPLSLNNDFFDDHAPWVDGFKNAVKKVSWGSSNVVVTFSPQLAILRYFVMPVMDRKFWNRAIPLESKKYIPISFDEVVYDFSVVAIDGGKKMGVLFGLTQKKSVEFLINTLKSAGLELASLETSSCSLERLFAFLDPKDHDVKAYIHFFGSQNLTLFSSGGYPVMYREKDFDSASSLTERKRLDIKGSVQFVERYVGGQAYKNLMLSGDNLEVWKDAAAQESQIPLVLWEPAKLADLKDNDTAAFFSLGASLKGAAAGRLTLDLSGISAASRLEKQVQSYVWGITAILGGLMLALSLITQVRLFMADSRLSGFKAKLGSASELQGNSVEAVRTKIKAMHENGRMLFGLINNRDYIAPKLQVIADTIPEALWIEEMRYTSPFFSDNTQSAAETITFSGKTALKGDMKFGIVNLFEKSLKTSAEFKIFMPPNGSIDHTLNSEAASGGGRSGTAGRAEPTGFNITCVLRRS
ncbi:MAG: hypothetical protein A2021_00530 [Elusimicrobia bacterium GWF2_52_66]|nr:MAG: hypothetical protein A2X33_06165 [Elusimicrobia bacterium GWA2_51_34]OGR85214.1 MAG: hypothetical protein A2021_00530 [Elusimicrobia bacterium GWF2_52_66]HAF94746.1 hypothetical protein [Elusimicrobiota bacterium]HCE97644.1 hypothetical protein [Elusimicrobiota bacterium]